jgi:hypothetical protein
LPESALVVMIETAYEDGVLEAVIPLKMILKGKKLITGIK